MPFNIRQDENNVIVEDLVVFECKSTYNADVFQSRLADMMGIHVDAIILTSEMVDKPEQKGSDAGSRQADLPSGQPSDDEASGMNDPLATDPV